MKDTYASKAFWVIGIATVVVVLLLVFGFFKEKESTQDDIGKTGRPEMGRDADGPAQ